MLHHIADRTPITAHRATAPGACIACGRPFKIGDRIYRVAALDAWCSYQCGRVEQSALERILARLQGPEPITTPAGGDTDL